MYNYVALAVLDFLSITISAVVSCNQAALFMAIHT